MNKAQLVGKIAGKSGLTKKDAEKALNAFVASVQEALVKKEKVQLIGFGTFEVKDGTVTVGIYVRCSGEGNGAWGKIDDAELNSSK